MVLTNTEKSWLSLTKLYGPHKYGKIMTFLDKFIWSSRQGKSWLFRTCEDHINLSRKVMIFPYLWGLYNFIKESHDFSVFVRTISLCQGKFSSRNYNVTVEWWKLWWQRQNKGKKSWLSLTKLYGPHNYGKIMTFLDKFVKESHDFSVFVRTLSLCQGKSWFFRNCEDHITLSRKVMIFP
jgi:hypothetical protein